MSAYELLARFNNDGTVAGVSIRNRTNVNGRDYEGDPEPLSGTDDPAYLQFASDFSAAIVAERDSLLARVADLTAECDELGAQVGPLQAQVTDLQSQLDAILNPPGPDLSTVDGAKQYISSERYERETAGFTVGEQFISTERDEIGHWFPRFYNALMWTQGDPYTVAGNPTGQYPFKPKDHAPTVLTAAQVMRAYECMAWYINACFAAEAQLYAALDAGTPIANVLAEIPAAWPQTAFEWVAPQ